MTKHPTLFGRKMRKGGLNGDHLLLGKFGIHPVQSLVEHRPHAWFGAGMGLVTPTFKSPHAAARALERKIVAAHRRLVKLMAGTKGRSK